MNTATQPALEFRPLTPDRWEDFEALFGPHGACGGCWCQWWKQTGSEYDRHKGTDNRQLMRRSVEAGEVPGLLAYHENQPMGWCAVEPRSAYARLGRSRILKPVDDIPVWSVTCFFIAKEWRKRGVMTRLLGAAIDFVRDQGGTVLEGYPVEPKKESVPAIYAYPGLASAFRRVGFQEILRRSETRPIMRYSLEP